jgi:hypothetical protein
VPGRQPAVVDSRRSILSQRRSPSLSLVPGSRVYQPDRAALSLPCILLSSSFSSFYPSFFLEINPDHQSHPRSKCTSHSFTGSFYAIQQHRHLAVNTTSFLDTNIATYLLDVRTSSNVDHHQSPRHHGQHRSSTVHTTTTTTTHSNTPVITAPTNDIETSNETSTSSRFPQLT